MTKSSNRHKNWTEYYYYYYSNNSSNSQDEQRPLMQQSYCPPPILLSTEDIAERCRSLGIEPTTMVDDSSVDYMSISSPESTSGSSTKSTTKDTCCFCM